MTGGPDRAAASVRRRTVLLSGLGGVGALAGAAGLAACGAGSPSPGASDSGDASPPPAEPGQGR